MNEEIEFILDSSKESMEKALEHLKKQFVNIRAGKASLLYQHGYLQTVFLNVQVPFPLIL